MWIYYRGDLKGRAFQRLSHPLGKPLHVHPWLFCTAQRGAQGLAPHWGIAKAGKDLLLCSSDAWLETSPGTTASSWYLGRCSTEQVAAAVVLRQEAGVSGSSLSPASLYIFPLTTELIRVKL